MLTLDVQHSCSNTRRVDKLDGRGPALDAAGLLAFTGVRDLPLGRAWMCERLRAAGTSEDVLNAMTVVPRHAFAPPGRWRVAYLDLDLWTGATWMTAPGTIARVVDALPRCRDLQILDVGTGTGYQAAVLAALGAEVMSVDVSPECLSSASERLLALGTARVQMLLGNGLEPGVVSAGFDGIVINAALPALPTRLFELLVPQGGVIVAPLVVSDGSQRLLRYAAVSGGELTVVDLGACKFPPAVTAVNAR